MIRFLTLSFLILNLCLVLPVQLSAQTGQIPVGIDEKAGENVPLDIQLYDEHGELHPLSHFMAGKPTFLQLVFYSCQGICTPLLNGVAEAIKQAPDLHPGDDFKMLAVSFDVSDTPSRAVAKQAAYLKLVGRTLPQDSWRFLTGNQENIDRLTNSVGFRYMVQEGTFVHAGVVIALSPDGKIIRYLYGGTISREVMPIAPFELQMALLESSEGRVGGAVHKILQFCFQYDPVGKRYALDVTRIFMLIIILFGLSLLLYVTLFSRISHKDSLGKVQGQGPQ